MTERTPGEWVMEDVRDFSGEHICFIRAEGEGDIARTRGVHPAIVQANAEYIVRAVNAHDALLAAAQDVDAAHEAFRTSTAVSVSGTLAVLLNAYTRLKAAIALAAETPAVERCPTCGSTTLVEGPDGDRDCPHCNPTYCGCHHATHLGRCPVPGCDCKEGDHAITD